MLVDAVSGDRESSSLTNPCDQMSPWCQQEFHAKCWPVRVIEQPASETTFRPMRKNHQRNTPDDIGQIPLVRDGNVCVAALFQQSLDRHWREMMEVSGQFQNEPVSAKECSLPASGVWNTEKQDASGL